MRKPLSNRKQLIKNLRTTIRLSRKCARQINRKLETLSQLNKAKTQIKEQLIKLMVDK